MNHGSYSNDGMYDDDMYSGGDLYSPPRTGSNSLFRVIKKVILFTVALIFGAAGLGNGFIFAAAIFSDRLVNAKPMEQGEIFGVLIAAIILLFIAKKSWTAARWG